MTRTILVLAIAFAFIAGTLVSGTVAFADGEKLTKLQKKCAEEPKKPHKIKADCELLNLINGVQAQLDSLSFEQTDPQEPVIEIMTNPASTESPFKVVDSSGTDLFQVLPDGAIQIGSNTVVLNPDGTITGGPIHIEAGSTIDSNPIASDVEIQSLQTQIDAATMATTDLEDRLFGIFRIDAGTGQTDTAQVFNATAVSCTFNLSATVGGLLNAPSDPTMLLYNWFDDDGVSAIDQRFAPPFATGVTDTVLTVLFDERTITFPPSTPVSVQSRVFAAGTVQDTVTNTCIIP